MKIGALSGSITKTNVGSSYLVAGTNVTITSASNGSITISSTGGGTPGGADTEIQYNSAGSFTGSNNLKYEFSNNFLSFSGSFAQGDSNKATNSFSHAEGLNTWAAGEASHAEGEQTFAVGDRSHAEGYSTRAGGQYSHAEGYYTTGSGNYSHAEGESTVARGDYSHAEGLYTIASGNYQHVGGKYNLRDNDFSLFVIGNGSGDDNALRSDIVRVNTDSVQITGSFIQSNSGSSFVGFMGNEVGSSPSVIGSDVFFFVSGSRNSEVASFGGDLVVSGTISIGGDSLEVTGTISATQGFSGSLTTLPDGTSYIIASNNISIASASNGPITIGAIPGGNNTEIQYNSSGAFTGSSTFTFNGTTVHLTGTLANGDNAVANGQYSHAEGYNTTVGAFAYASHAEGSFTNAVSAYSHAEGYATTVYGQQAHAEGSNNQAYGSQSHAEGYLTRAISDSSHSEGVDTYSGYEGFDYDDIVAGVVTINSSYGDVSTSFNGSSFALLTLFPGTNDIAYEFSSVSYSAPNTIVTLVDTSVNEVRPGLIGLRGVPSLIGANRRSMGVGSHSEGCSTRAQPRYSHAEGYQSLALAERSHAEGVSTTTIGVGSHSEGLGTIASGSYQHVGGKYNIRNNDFSLLVVGNGTSDADVDRSDVFRINSGSAGDGRVEVTGSLAATMGLSGSLTQLVDGTSYLVAGANVTITSASNGSVTISSAGGSGSPGGSDTEIQYNSAGSFAGSSNFTYSGTTVFLSGSFNQGLQNVVSGLYSHAEGYETLAVGSYSHAEGGTGGGGQLIASGTYSHAEGYNTIAYASGSHAEGYDTKAGALGYYSNSISSGVITLDASYGDLSSTGSGLIIDGSFIVLNDYSYQNNYTSPVLQVNTSVWNGTNTVLTLFDLSVSTAEAVIGRSEGGAFIGADFPLGQFSHAEGIYTFAAGFASHAEGYSSTIAVGYASHAEGAGTIARGVSSHSEGNAAIASGTASHAEGNSTIAVGYASHAEGESTIAVGDHSHAEGQETIASGSHQHVGGKYNTRGNDFSLFVIGNGTSDLDDDRSDIFRINTDSVQVSGSLIVSGAYIHNVVSGTTAPNYTVGTWDHVIVFSNNVVTATLPSAAPIGRKLIFKDGTGAASTAGGQMLSCSLGAIDGSSTYTMASVNYTAVSVIKINDPDEWIIV